MLLTCIILLELFEFFWQKGDTIKEYMQSLMNAFQRGTIFFISLHPSFFFVLFTIFTLNIKSPFLLAVGVLKFVDIGFKIYVLDRMNKGIEVYQNIFKENIKLSTISKILSSVLYISLFYLAISLSHNLA